MTTDLEDTDLPPVEIIRDPEVVAALLRPPRLALLNALREPDSATGLARRLEEPRQRLNHHLHELERLGLVVLVEQRPRRNFTERVLRASARRYVLSPEILGELGTFGPEDLVDPYAWSSLAAGAARTLSELARWHAAAEGYPSTLTVPSRLRFASTESLDAFTVELTEQLGRPRHPEVSSGQGAIYRPRATRPARGPGRDALRPLRRHRPFQAMLVPAVEP